MKNIFLILFLLLLGIQIISIGYIYTLNSKIYQIDIELDTIQETILYSSDPSYSNIGSIPGIQSGDDLNLDVPLGTLEPLGGPGSSSAE